MAESLLRAAARIAEAQGRRIEVLTPRAGICPVMSSAIVEVPLARFSSNIFLCDHFTVPHYANSKSRVVLYNIKLVLPEFLRQPGFTTFHDLMYYPQPSKYNWREYLFFDSLYMRIFVRRTVKRAHMVHVDSNHTQKDALDLFPFRKESFFRCIHPGVDKERFCHRRTENGDVPIWDSLLERGVRSNYILYTGGLSKRKNLKPLLKAFREFFASQPEFQLVITGGAKPTLLDPEVQFMMENMPPGSFVRLGTVGNRELELLYQQAWAYVFPSLYEGFGLPVLEAQASGIPVICSNATSLPEVARSAAQLFPPESSEELLNCLKALLNEETRQEWIVKGKGNVEDFSWEKTAERWLELSDEVYEKGRVKSSWFLF